MLGSQWSKEELECFYEAFRKYGKDWKKVASVVRNRSVEMVEALYTMNRHPWRGIIIQFLGSDGQFLSYSRPVASSSGCLPLLKKKRSGGSRPRAVGRTPRFPVSYSYEKVNGEKFFSPTRQGLKLKVDANDDDVAHEVALTLAEASQRGGSPQVSCDVPVHVLLVIFNQVFSQTLTDLCPLQCLVIVARAQVPPPGFSMPNRAPPLGFASHESMEPSFDAMSCHCLLLLPSSFSNKICGCREIFEFGYTSYYPHFAGILCLMLPCIEINIEPPPEILVILRIFEFMDPAILALGKGDFWWA
ncbi:Protein ALWAYS EARLY 3 [Camellia lanceoleosa]|uniref:Protein ALWAYS EARLY 3 n=1 Tax=Camellia lanceoleosa TaxID=1840588 RepID=A0ACC0HS97_9ERIC|nr:Protein ALWAYS EARLY 3 [Camellia lanceoleosa]